MEEAEEGELIVSASPPAKRRRRDEKGSAIPSYGVAHDSVLVERHEPGELPDLSADAQLPARYARRKESKKKRKKALDAAHALASAQAGQTPATAFDVRSVYGPNVRNHDP